MSLAKKVSLAAAVLAILVIVGKSAFWNPVPTNSDADILVAQGNRCLDSEFPKRRRQGIEFLEQALKLEPTSIPAQFGLFNAYPPGSPKALAAASNLMQICPKLAEAHYAEACMKWWDWKFTNAVAEAEKATKLRAASGEDRAWAHCLFGWFLVETGHPNEALEEYQKAERLLPDNPTIESHLGHPYFVQRRFKEALYRYQKSLKIDPDGLLCHRAMAQIAEANGDILKAIDEDELANMSRNEPATKNYYEKLREAFRTGGADGYYGKLLELARNDAKPNSYWIARNYAAKGEKDLAYKWLWKAVDEHNGSLADDFTFALVFDHEDKRFKDIARKIGIMRWAERGQEHRGEDRNDGDHNRSQSR